MTPRFIHGLLAALVVGSLLLDPETCRGGREAQGRYTQVHRIGPVDLPAHRGHHAMIHSTTDEVFSPIHPQRTISLQQEGWVVGFVPAVKDAADRPLPGSLLHHVLLVNRGGGGPAADPSALRWGIGTGSELTPFEVPDGYGLLVSAHDQLELTCMFDNPFQATYHDVSCQASLRFQPAQPNVPPLRNLITVWLKVDPGDGYGYWVPPGFHRQSQLVQFPVDGRVVFMAAHLHAYARRLILEELKDPRVVWTALPEQADNGQLVRVPTWSSPTGWRVQAGVDYRLTAQYHNPTDHPIDAMGVLGALVVPDVPFDG